MTAPRVPVVGDEVRHGKRRGIVVAVLGPHGWAALSHWVMWLDSLYVLAYNERKEYLDYPGTAPNDLRLRAGWPLDPAQPPPVGSTVKARTWGLSRAEPVTEIECRRFRFPNRDNWILWNSEFWTVVSLPDGTEA